MPRGRKKQALSAARAISVERAIARLKEEAEFWISKAGRLAELVQSMQAELTEAARGPVRRGRPPAAMKSLRGAAAGGKRRGGGGGRRGRGPGTGAAAAQVLRDWGRPARVGEILPELAKRGVKVGGKNPMATLASTLLKFAGVKRVERGLFAAADSAAPRKKPGRKPGKRAKATVGAAAESAT